MAARAVLADGRDGRRSRRVSDRISPKLTQERCHCSRRARACVRYRPCRDRRCTTARAAPGTQDCSYSLRRL
jgi:hypothetical protein